MVQKQKAKSAKKDAHHGTSTMSEISLKEYKYNFLKLLLLLLLFTTSEMRDFESKLSL